MLSRRYLNSDVASTATLADTGGISGLRDCLINPLSIHHHPRDFSRFTFALGNDLLLILYPVRALLVMVKGGLSKLYYKRVVGVGHFTAKFSEGDIITFIALPRRHNPPQMPTPTPLPHAHSRRQTKRKQSLHFSNSILDPLRPPSRSHRTTQTPKKVISPSSLPQSRDTDRPLRAKLSPSHAP